MKYSKILRALAVAVILSLLVIAIPAAPALAAEDIELDEDNLSYAKYALAKRIAMGTMNELEHITIVTVREKGK